MSEHDAEGQPRQGSPAPGLEGEGGDYDDTGSVESPTENLADSEYPDGDYSPSGSVGSARQEDAIRERLTDGQVNTTAEERGPLHGDGNVER